MVKKLIMSFLASEYRVIGGRILTGDTVVYKNERQLYYYGNDIDVESLDSKGLDVNSILYATKEDFESKINGKLVTGKHVKRVIHRLEPYNPNRAV